MDCCYSQWDGWMDWWNDGCKDATTRIDNWINATHPEMDGWMDATHLCMY